jgi:hypothetical protein
MLSRRKGYNSIIPRYMYMRRKKEKHMDSAMYEKRTNFG